MTYIKAGKLCVVCARSDQPGMVRRSGFKCLKCIGKRSKKGIRKVAEKQSMMEKETYRSLPVMAVEGAPQTSLRPSMDVPLPVFLQQRLGDPVENRTLADNSHTSISDVNTSNYSSRASSRRSSVTQPPLPVSTVPPKQMVDSASSPISFSPHVDREVVSPAPEYFHRSQVEELEPDYFNQIVKSVRGRSKSKKGTGNTTPVTFVKHPVPVAKRPQWKDVNTNHGHTHNKDRLSKRGLSMSNATEDRDLYRLSDLDVRAAELISFAGGLNRGVDVPAKVDDLQNFLQANAMSVFSADDEATARNEALYNQLSRRGKSKDRKPRRSEVRTNRLFANDSHLSQFGIDDELQDLQRELKNSRLDNYKHSASASRTFNGPAAAAFDDPVDFFNQTSHMPPPSRQFNRTPSRKHAVVNRSMDDVPQQSNVFSFDSPYQPSNGLTSV